MGAIASVSTQTSRATRDRQAGKGRRNRVSPSNGPCDSQLDEGVLGMLGLELGGVVAGWCAARSFPQAGGCETVTVVAVAGMMDSQGSWSHGYEE
jgi:hypothetical protein